MSGRGRLVEWSAALLTAQCAALWLAVVEDAARVWCRCRLAVKGDLFQLKVVVASTCLWARHVTWWRLILVEVCGQGC